MTDAPRPTLSRSTRVTSSAFYIPGAPATKIGWRTVVPFEIEVVWSNGVRSSEVTVRSWIMHNGSPRKVHTAVVDASDLPVWLFDLVVALEEPTGYDFDPAFEASFADFSG